MTELLRVHADVGAGSARRRVREPDRSRPRSAPAASATFGRGRARAVRRSCCCTISSARRRHRCARDRGGATDPDAFTGAVADVARAQPASSIRTGRARSRGSSCATMPSPASCSPAAKRSRRRSSSRRPIPRARCSAWSIRCGSIPSSCTPCGNIKFRGCTALVRFALDRLPDVPGLDGSVGRARRHRESHADARRARARVRRGEVRRRFRRAARRDHGAVAALAVARARAASTCSLRACSTRRTSCATARRGTTIASVRARRHGHDGRSIARHAGLRATRAASGGAHTGRPRGALRRRPRAR